MKILWALVFSLVFIVSGCSSLNKNTRNRDLAIMFATVAGKEACMELPICCEKAEYAKNTLAKLMTFGPDWLHSNLASMTVGEKQAVDMIWWAYHYGITNSGINEKDLGVYGEILKAAMDGCIKGLDVLSRRKNTSQ